MEALIVGIIIIVLALVSIFLLSISRFKATGNYFYSGVALGAIATVAFVILGVALGVALHYLAI
jgi:hypothetical protein